MSHLVEGITSKDLKTIKKLGVKLESLAKEVQQLKTRVRILENKSNIHVPQSEGEGESGGDENCIVS